MTAKTTEKAAVTLTTEQAKNNLAFLKRVQLQGNEAFLFCDLVKTLEEGINKEEIKQYKSVPC